MKNEELSCYFSVFLKHMVPTLKNKGETAQKA